MNQKELFFEILTYTNFELKGDLYLPWQDNRRGKRERDRERERELCCVASR